jgi:hypothetical protein
MHQSVSDHIDPKTLILIWDTGGSAGLTPFRSDFIDYVECEIDVRDVTKVNKVIGVGTTLHKFVDVAGNDVYLPCVSYHLHQQISVCSLPRFAIKFMVVIPW